jgi:lipoprotein-anchoring transpeptidase ErfK/SrfK
MHTAEQVDNLLRRMRGPIAFRRLAAIAVTVLCATLFAPTGSPAVSKFPAAGTLIQSSVVVRNRPSAGARRMLTLYELRRDYRPQIVLAIGSRRVGFVPATHARLTIRNTGGSNALELRAIDSGKDSNTIRVSIQDVAANPGQDDLVIFIGGVELFRFRYADGDTGGLANAVNASSAPVTAAALTGGPLTPIGPTALSGGSDGKPGTVWYRLNLPIRPFGQTGWIPANAAHVRPTSKRVVIRRNARVLDVYSRGRRVFRARVAVGRPDRKTPLGRFYVAAKYRPRPNALVSTYALELSAPAGLPDFLRGGVVGIHGTPALYTIGKAASNGCIRVAPRVALRLKRLVPLGTPVNVVS